MLELIEASRHRIGRTFKRIEAARNLFDLLRRLDARGYETIHAELAPPAGIGAAYNDRLTRAAAR